MSVVIVGGNERMIRQYEQLCKSYSCKAKVYIETDKGIQNFGSTGFGRAFHKHNVS